MPTGRTCFPNSLVVPTACRLAMILSIDLVATIASAAAPTEKGDPTPLLTATWLESHQRLCFGIDEKNLDEAIHDGCNVICGGTNAAGIGFAGGPFILGRNGEIVEIRTGEPVSDKTLQAIRDACGPGACAGPK